MDGDLPGQTRRSPPQNGEPTVIRWEPLGFFQKRIPAQKNFFYLVSPKRIGEHGTLEAIASAGAQLLHLFCGADVLCSYPEPKTVSLRDDRTQQWKGANRRQRIGRATDLKRING